MANRKGHWKWIDEEYRRWLTSLDEELLKRSGQNTDDFLDYPFAEGFVMERTPEETAIVMVERSFFYRMKGALLQTIGSDMNEEIASMSRELKEMNPHRNIPCRWIEEVEERQVLGKTNLNILMDRLLISSYQDGNLISRTQITGWKKWQSLRLF